MTDVSVLIPVYNAGPALVETVRSILRQRPSSDTLTFILVDDGSTDDSVGRVRAACPDARVTVVRTPGVGAAAAMNAGLTHVRTPLVAQIDQDVVLHEGWLSRLLPLFETPTVAAVQGQYVTDSGASLLARVMGRDLQERYAVMSERPTHVCTGNVVYRTDALRAIGGFDASMGYGYDNDVSYRLRAAGFELRYCAEATSTHRWRDGLSGYLRQQYGFGYGRLDVVTRHRGHVGGDSVSPTFMMLHPLVLGAALGLGALSFVAPGHDVTVWLALCGVAALVLERAVVGARAAWRFRDWTPLLFPVAHLARDAAWIAAMLVWLTRRVLGTPGLPEHSMRTQRVVRHAGPSTATSAPGRSVRGGNPEPRVPQPADG